MPQVQPLDFELSVSAQERVSIRVTQIWVAAILTLFALHWAGTIGYLVLGEDHFVPRLLLALFYLDAEAKVPAWFSSCTLWTCGLLLLSIGWLLLDKYRRFSAAWLILGLAFLGLSLDESIALHERLNPEIRQIEGLGDAKFPPWTIPAAGFVLIGGIIYLPFLRRLPQVTRNLFIAGGCLYVFAALGLEIVGGYVKSAEGASHSLWFYRIVMSLEEICEMGGLVIFMHGLTSYLIAMIRNRAAKSIGEG